jgi:hypothetical protein
MQFVQIFWNFFFRIFQKIGISYPIPISMGQKMCFSSWCKEIIENLASGLFVLYRKIKWNNFLLCIIPLTDLLLTNSIYRVHCAMPIKLLLVSLLRYPLKLDSIVTYYPALKLKIKVTSIFIYLVRIFKLGTLKSLIGIEAHYWVRFFILTRLRQKLSSICDDDLILIWNLVLPLYIAPGHRNSLVHKIIIAPCDHHKVICCRFTQ